MKLAKEFKKIRSKKLLSLADVANKCDITRSTIWKLEQGNLPKGENFKIIISKGLGIKKDSAQYRRLVGLWTAERLGAQTMTDETLSSQIKANENELRWEAKELLTLIKGLSSNQLEQIKLTLERPQVLDALETLNELYAA